LIHFNPPVDLVDFSVEAMALATYYIVEVLAVAGGFLADTGEVRSTDMRECHWAAVGVCGRRVAEARGNWLTSAG